VDGLRTALLASRDRIDSRRVVIINVENDITGFYSGDALVYHTLWNANREDFATPNSDPTYTADWRGQQHAASWPGWGYLVDPLVFNNIGNVGNRFAGNRYDRVVIRGTRKADGSNPVINASMVINDSNVLFEYLDLFPTVAVCKDFPHGTIPEESPWRAPSIQRQDWGGFNVFTDRKDMPSYTGTVQLNRGDEIIYDTEFWCAGTGHQYAGMVVKGGSFVIMGDSNLDMENVAHVSKTVPLVASTLPGGSAKPAPKNRVSSQVAPTSAQPWDVGNAAVTDEPLYGVLVEGARDFYMDRVTINNPGRYGLVANAPLFNVALIPANCISPSLGNFGGLGNVMCPPVEIMEDNAISGGEFSMVLNVPPASVTLPKTNDPAIVFTDLLVNNRVPVNLGTITFTLAGDTEFTAATGETAFFNARSLWFHPVHNPDGIRTTEVAAWANLTGGEYIAQIDEPTFPRSRFASVAAFLLPNIVQRAYQPVADAAAEHVASRYSNILEIAEAREEFARERIKWSLWVDDTMEDEMPQALEGSVRVNYPVTYSFTYSYEFQMNIAIAEVLIPNADDRFADMSVSYPGGYWTGATVRMGLPDGSEGFLDADHNTAVHAALEAAMLGVEAATVGMPVVRIIPTTTGGPITTSNWLGGAADGVGVGTGALRGTTFDSESLLEWLQSNENPYPWETVW
jgi:hypothetical protein